MKLSTIPTIFVAAAISAPTLAVADEELEFDEAYLYFELNDTDGDLGIHGKVDGGPWKKVEIEGPNDRTLLKISARSRLARQGMTELFFESAEPCFPETCEDPDDALDPADFFARFPEGAYEWEGVTTEYEEIEGEVYLSQRIPAAPVVASISGLEPGEECWVPVGEEIPDEVVIDWEPVTHTHAMLGSDWGAPLGVNKVIYYEFVVEIDGTEYKSTALIPPALDDGMPVNNSWTVPEQFIELAENTKVQAEDEEGEPLFNEDGTPVLEDVDEIKFEIIVRVETGVQLDDDGDEIASKPGNQSAVESCFALEAEAEEEEA